MAAIFLRTLLVLACGATLTAQDRLVTVQNLVPVQRQEWVRAVVPFAQGEVPGLPALHIEGMPTVWQAIGARWRDGSLRQALCFFAPKLEAMQERNLALIPGKGPNLPKLEFGIALERFEIIVKEGGRVHRARPTQVEILEDNPARKVTLLRCRVGKSGLVAELTLETYAGQSHAYAGLAVFFSDPVSESMQIQIERLSVETEGMALVLRHAGPHAVRQQFNSKGSRITLLSDTYLGDGQGIRRVGVLIPPLISDNSLLSQTITAAAICPVLAAADWRSSGAFGPFGYVPANPPWLPAGGLRTAMARRHREFVRFSQMDPAKGDPFRDDGFGLARFAGQSGDQSDFGLVKMEAVAGSGLPSFLYEVEYSVLKEACRPGHFFETDGSPLRASDHPDWVVWDGRTHWHGNVSRDRLGKPFPTPRWEAHGWTGKDRQHWSNNYICAYYLLTGDPHIQRELDNEVQLYLAAQTLRPELTTSGSGSPRGAGRTLLSACWLYLCTGNEELLTRMRKRMHQIYIPSWRGRGFAEHLVRPYGVSHKDDRQLSGKYEFWNPWQDSLAAIGFAAYHRITGDDAALELIDGLSLNCLRHAWQIDENGRAVIAMTIRFKAGGEVLTAQERMDENQLSWSYNTAFSEWSIAAVELGRQAAIRHKKPELEAHAEEILAQMRSSRRRPADGWFDRFGQWDAIR